MAEGEWKLPVAGSSRPHSGLRKTQKENFNANCPIRGARTPVTWPKLPANITGTDW